MPPSGPVQSPSHTFAPWYTTELQRMKTAGCVLEWCFKASGLTVHKQAFREHQKVYAKSLKVARFQFYSNIINNNPGNSKQIFSTISHLLKPSTISHSDATEEKCNNFINFFKNKIVTIRSLLSSPSSPSATPTILADPLPGPSRPLSYLSSVTQQEVEDAR
ncbi:uncharacterized protein AKAME5_001579300 [Lates japonicus]|uniref:Uncharacterized protein n=1 Tax=Lates japonicus TaxID=270547 RepID=A0AAD3N2F0_LATJO|nr:uncharacterized protein AKAME5_001579300 [Lates japonicus]